MKKSLQARLVAATAVAAAIVTVLGSAKPASADDPPQLGVLATLNVATLFPADDPILTDPANNNQATNDPPHLPPGGKFKLFGTAKDDVDPENPFNEVISFDTTNPATVAGAVKLFGDKVKVDMLDDQVELKYYYLGRTCGGGSTRFQLGISGNGDPQFNLVRVEREVVGRSSRVGPIRTPSATSATCHSAGAVFPAHGTTRT